MTHNELREQIENIVLAHVEITDGAVYQRQIADSILSLLRKALPKKKTIIYANGDLREITTYHENIGFNQALSDINRLLGEEV